MRCETLETILSAVPMMGGDPLADVLAPCEIRRIALTLLSTAPVAAERQVAFHSREVNLLDFMVVDPVAPLPMIRDQVSQLT